MTWLAKLFTKEAIISPTALTVLRGILALILPFFLLSPKTSHHLIGALIFTIGAVTDFLDGWWARKSNRITDLGKILDPITDKMLILISMLIFASLGYFSPWWIVPIFIRELSVTFCRIGWLLQGQAIAAEMLGKWKFGMQVTVIGSALLLMLSRDFSWLNFTSGLFSLLLGVSLFIATALTVISGVSFFRGNWSALQSPQFAKYLSAYGVGLLPKAPGTWGSAVAMILICLVHWSVPLYLLTFAAVIVLGYWSASKLDLEKEKDPGYIVSDEVAGMFVSFLFVPISLSSVITGFCIFRLMDIVKPPPCRYLEKMPGFAGILNDDLMAGVYTWVILYLAFGLV